MALEDNRLAQDIARSWEVNALAWTSAVREKVIESRRLATDRAVVDAILASTPSTVLDVGCGEGWLCRELEAKGVSTVGVDGSQALIAAVREASPGKYEVLDYRNPTGEAHLGTFDCIVCNFSLLDEVVQPALRWMRRQLAPAGRLVVQTVHPWTAAQDQSYASGWRVENWRAFGDAFTQPMPWYFRTLESWVSELQHAGLAVMGLQEPRHPSTLQPVSLLLTAQALG